MDTSIHGIASYLYLGLVCIFEKLIVKVSVGSYSYSLGTWVIYVCNS